LYLKCSQRYFGNASLRIARILCGRRTHSLPFSVGIQFAEIVYWTSQKSRKKRMDGSLIFAINVNN
jgi:hypothetical protein